MCGAHAACRTKEPSETSGNQNKEYQKLTLDMFNDKKPTEEDLHYFNLLSFERLD